ncbi:MAG: NepR family anti-sigma factor [Alkalilacustris sp.]
MSHTDQSPPSQPARRSRGGKRDLSPELQRQIDENLRRLYGQPAEDSLPDHLQSLVDRLRNRDSAP